MRAFSFLLALLLVGCSNTPPIVEYRERVVPVRVACVESVPNEPVYATAAVTDDFTIEQVSDAYMIERNQLRSYVARLIAVITGCIEDDGDGSLD